ncbi:MAG: hypothetical protein FJ109_10690 [Deltaproteobacteria bacterium]|nr:hypothetical protein [Deltaproteobacteria bacterium]
MRTKRNVLSLLVASMLLAWTAAAAAGENANNELPAALESPANETQVAAPESAAEGSPATLESAAEEATPPDGGSDMDLLGWAKRQGGYFGWLGREIEMVGGMDLYGVTSQLPKGYMSAKYQWTTIRAGKRYNNKRALGPVMQPIAFTAPDGSEVLNIDLGLQGYGGGHTFQFSYGITDPLDYYIELPFTYMNVKFKPKMAAIKGADGKTYTDKDGNTYKIHPDWAPLLGIKDPLNYDECNFMYETLPALGRPAPATTYIGKWMMGDINTGFSWNPFRTNRMSVALTPRVFLPTGHQPNANNNLLYGTGPELETGIGGWAAGATQGYDFRIFKYKYWLNVLFSSEFTATYAFEQQRKYPTNFPKPSPTAQQLDAQSFPDLSNLEGTFRYTPGWSVDWTAQLQIQLAVIGLGIGYGITHSQEPELMADPAFTSMVKGLELLGQQTTQAVMFAGSLSLLPLFIPADLGVQYAHVVDGYNAIVMDDYWQVTVKGYIPVKLLWE